MWGPPPVSTPVAWSVRRKPGRCKEQSKMCCTKYLELWDGRLGNYHDLHWVLPPAPPGLCFLPVAAILVKISDFLSPSSSQHSPCISVFSVQSPNDRVEFLFEFLENIRTGLLRVTWGMSVDPPVYQVLRFVNSTKITKLINYSVLWGLIEWSVGNHTLLIVATLNLCDIQNISVSGSSANSGIPVELPAWLYFDFSERKLQTNNEWIKNSASRVEELH